MAAAPPVGRLLRDRTAVTRLLVLRAFRERPRTTFREIGAELDVTVQAVSTYVHGLAEDGLLEDRDGGFAVTPSGLAALTEGLARLKRAVDEAYTPLAVVDLASAIAGNRIAPGDEVGLFMEAGDLVARAGAESASRGRAVTAAERGEEVIVRDLAGVVDLKPGRLVVLKVPSPVEGGSRRVPARRVRAALAREGLDAARVGAFGTGARALARRAGLAVDFDFAGVEASFNAAELGLDVALFVSRDLLQDALQVLDERNARTLRRVPIAIVDLPLEGAPPDLSSAPPAPRARGRARR